MQTILITGVSGFIGSRTATHFLQNNYQVLGISRSPAAIDHLHYIHLQIDLTSSRSYRVLDKLFTKYNILRVIHLAAFIQVGEGEQYPEMYYYNNIQSTKNLLKAMVRHQVGSLIFSSTAAVYKPHNNMNWLSENDPTGPVSVYGDTKLKCEHLLEKYSNKYGLQIIVLRFFNAAGGLEKYNHPAIHLIPIVIEKIMHSEKIKVFGTDYPTKDGTCYRDYIHVKDLVNAIHIVNSKWLNLLLNYGHKNNTGMFRIYNIGMNKCYSVLEVIHNVLEVMGKTDQEQHIEFTARRQGDPPVLLANCNRAFAELGWKASLNLNAIVVDTISEMVSSEQYTPLEYVFT